MISMIFAQPVSEISNSGIMLLEIFRTYSPDPPDRVADAVRFFVVFQV